MHNKTKPKPYHNKTKTIPKPYQNHTTNRSVFGSVLKPNQHPKRTKFERETNQKSMKTASTFLCKVVHIIHKYWFGFWFVFRSNLVRFRCWFGFKTEPKTNRFVIWFWYGFGTVLVWFWFGLVLSRTKIKQIYIRMYVHALHNGVV